jgi:hypothetical protein
MELWIWKASFTLVDTGQTYSEASARVFGSRKEAERDFEERKRGKIPFRFAKTYTFLPSELTLKSVEFIQKR